MAAATARRLGTASATPTSTGWRGDGPSKRGATLVRSSQSRLLLWAHILLALEAAAHLARCIACGGRRRLAPVARGLVPLGAELGLQQLRAELLDLLQELQGQLPSRRCWLFPRTCLPRIGLVPDLQPLEVAQQGATEVPSWRSPLLRGALAGTVAAQPRLLGPGRHHQWRSLRGLEQLAEALMELLRPGFAGLAEDLLLLALASHELDAASELHVLLASV